MKALFEEFPTLLGLSGTHEVFSLDGITSADRQAFIDKFYPVAQVVGKKFSLNPVVILAQAAMESGWGTSYMAKNIFNFFGITAFGSKNDFWKGDAYTSKTSGLKFRKYASAQDGFSDFARLITSKYKTAAGTSESVADYAHAIAYSPYISENNGDNREAYRKGIINNAATILKQADPAAAARLVAESKTNTSNNSQPPQAPARKAAERTDEPNEKGSGTLALVALAAAAGLLLFSFSSTPKSK